MFDGKIHRPNIAQPRPKWSKMSQGSGSLSPFHHGFFSGASPFLSPFRWDQITIEIQVFMVKSSVLLLKSS